MPLTVRIHRDRNRVSSRNRPWLSIGVASMSPRRPLTTNVLPSRMLTELRDMSGLLCVERGVHEGRSRAKAQHDPGPEPAVAFLIDESAQRSDDDVHLAAQQLDQILARRADGGDVDRSLVVREGEVTIVDDEHPQRLVPDRQAYAPADAGESGRVRLPPLCLGLAPVTLVLHDAALQPSGVTAGLPRSSI